MTSLKLRAPDSIDCISNISIELWKALHIMIIFIIIVWPSMQRTISVTRRNHLYSWLFIYFLLHYYIYIYILYHDFFFSCFVVVVILFLPIFPFHFIFYDITSTWWIKWYKRHKNTHNQKYDFSLILFFYDPYVQLFTA